MLQSSENNLFKPKPISVHDRPMGLLKTPVDPGARVRKWQQALAGG